MKRFYISVSVATPTHNGYGILLDGKAVKTARGFALELPTRALADAIAEEWAEQGETIAPALMPLTRLAHVARDGVSADFDRAAGQAFGYAKSDLVCYRAEAPAELAARQAAGWNPLLDWLAETFGARLTVTHGVGFVEQPADSLAKLQHAVWHHDAFVLAGLLAATTIMGSLVLAMAMEAGRLDAAQAFAASRIDETFQAEKWGEDAEAAARAAGHLSDLESAEAFIRLSKA